MHKETLRLDSDEWLSRFFARPTYRLHVSEEIVAADAMEVVASIREQRAFVYAKVNVSAIRAAMVLQAVGFYVVDTNIILEKPIQKSCPLMHGSFRIRATLESDKSQVVALASTSFIYTRFHLDPYIAKTVADSIKAAWAASYYDGHRGDDMIVAERDGQIIGFLQLMNGSDDDWVIDLIAVHERYRGQGVAASMIRYAEGRTARTRYVAGTQAANMPSLRLYESLGFRVRCAAYVFHAHMDRGCRL